MPIELIHNDPMTAVELLRDAVGVQPPSFATAAVESVDFAQLAPVEFRADSVVVLRDVAGGAQLALIVEVQKPNYVFAVLPSVARKHLEEIVTTTSHDYEHIASQYLSHWVDQGRQEGRAEGEGAAILAVLETRGLEISSDTRDRITRCDDLNMLETWIRRAVTVSSADELFA
ncbi:hypothetical protein [Planotetraspora mira]|uniref:Uncharacterized protein n=1 Tax=Planotetraspora mira TaxID=58121 RepID=A0A8J3U179_9ACTN|nr:hypothetical protein [Planotetraspora mira]GII30930.1 hypothetical protein Pmi06nite_43720 [Planotetraspora mira]